LSQRFQILALDGGGIKGLFSAAVLAHIEEDLQIDITEYFDLIVGSSTGGIIALGLGLGLRPKRLVDFYAQRGPGIFRGLYGLRSIGHWLFRKFSQQALCEALKSPDVFGDRKLGDSKKPLVITSYDLGDDDVYLFKSPHHAHLKRDWKVPAWQVALATSAAPTYFPPCRHVDNIRHVDGGLWANNPTLVGIAEAVSMFGVPLDQISVLNLGTSDEVVRRPKHLNWGGKVLWAKPAVDLVMRSQSLGVYTQSLHLLGRENVIRLDPKVPKGLFALDKVNRATELMAKAAYESRILMPDLEKRFLQHTARPYFPYYPRN
jgi:patatin-like phospholipase/acyl hydrolase